MNLVCAKLSLADLFMGIRQALSGKDIPKETRTKDLVLELTVKFILVEDWVAELLTESEVKSLDPTDMLTSAFRFKAVLLNFIEYCPIELVD